MQTSTVLDYCEVLTIYHSDSIQDVARHKSGMRAIQKKFLSCLQLRGRTQQDVHHISHQVNVILNMIQHMSTSETQNCSNLQIK
jgi:hypothetical protein